MPEYNNGIPNAQQPSQEPNTTLPGLSDNTMAQSQVGGLQVSQMQNNQNMQNQVNPQQLDKVDTAAQIREGEIKEEFRQREIIDKAIAKAMAIHENEFMVGDYQIQEAKMLTRPGKDRADTAQLSISTRDGLDFQMFFDDEGSLVIENHKNDISQNMVGGKYMSLDNPDMDLSTPEKQEMYLSKIDESKAGLTLRKEDMEKDIQEMGFQNKEEMARDTGVNVDEALTAPNMEKNQAKQNLQSQAANSILKNATMVVNGDKKFDTRRNVNDVLNTPGAKQIIAVGSQVYSTDGQGNVKKENLRVQGSVSSVQLAAGYARDTRIDQVITSSNNPTEGIGVGNGGAPQGVKGLNGEVAMSRSLEEAPNSDTPKVDTLFEKDQDQTHHAEEMYQQNGPERIDELHTSNDATGKRLSAIADKYGLDIKDVEDKYHDKLARGIPSQEALDATQKECDDQYAEAMHEPTLEPRSPFDPPNG